MIDRLKFRVWDGEFKEYVQERQELRPDGSLIVEYDPQCDDGYSCMQYIDITKEPERYTVEQCTGLKDRNDKLIFEGDVCSARMPDGTPPLEVVIKWKRGGWWCECDDASDCTMDSLIQDGAVFEVIGNIHEVEDESI